MIAVIDVPCSGKSGAVKKVAMLGLLTANQSLFKKGAFQGLTLSSCCYMSNCFGTSSPEARRPAWSMSWPPTSNGSRSSKPTG